MVKAISFVAASGTGKTTLLEKIIAKLKERNYRVGALKHDAHDFEIDHPGKDSYRLSAAGADTMLITSSRKIALVKKQKHIPEIEDLLNRYFYDVDIVLIEGFKRLRLPKIEVNRREINRELLFLDDPTLIAVVTDQNLKLNIPIFHINDIDSITNFIEERFLRV
ncbi:MAG: molybdopterin-guanine dinucleotide biosynthesis protein B [Nitrospirae bacterium]|nr:MAG: molybdopterin-guanine dinucleotide biosynthesis protein B [Nitrospirota bacterium]